MKKEETFTDRNAARRKQIAEQKAGLKGNDTPPKDPKEVEPEDNEDNEETPEDTQKVEAVKTPVKRGRKPSEKRKKQLSINIDPEIEEIVRLLVPSMFDSVSDYFNNIAIADFEKNRAKYEKIAEMQRQLNEMDK